MVNQPSNYMVFIEFFKGKPLKLHHKASKTASLKVIFNSKSANNAEKNIG